MAASGWKIEGNFPNEPKYVMAVIPHTSNYDFLVGVQPLLAMGLRLKFLGKSSLFWEPQGTILRWLGGVPVDRGSGGGIAGEAVRQFEANDQFVLVITPEGTRRKVNRWRTGFYRIARDAGVPIVPVAFDYGTKTIKIGPPLTPSGDMKADYVELGKFFAGVEAKNPEFAYLGLQTEMPSSG
jgi:1-acyl-sn-glycerol-3-phosphate acyltransferase